MNSQGNAPKAKRITHRSRSHTLACRKIADHGKCFVHRRRSKKTLRNFIAQAKPILIRCIHRSSP